MNAAQKYVVQPLHRAVVVPFMQVIRGGIPAQSLALSIAVGVAGGIFPVPGITTAVALALALPFKTSVNRVIVTVANLLCTIPDVLLMPAFIALGGHVLGSTETVSVDKILEVRDTGGAWGGGACLCQFVCACSVCLCHSVSLSLSVSLCP